MNQYCRRLKRPHAAGRACDNRRRKHCICLASATPIDDGTYTALKESSSFSAHLHRLLATQVGRPTPLLRARNYSHWLNQKLGTTGVQVWLKREDLCHTGSHCANSAYGQALVASKFAHDRCIVPTANGQMGAAAAAACASFGLECEVHMAGAGMAMQSANVPFIRARGAWLYEAGGKDGQLHDADNAAQQSVNDCDDASAFLFARSCVGNAPYPQMVRDFQRCIGDEVYEQAVEAFGALPDALFACIGGGSNALGLFDAFTNIGNIRLFGCTSASTESFVMGLGGRPGPGVTDLLHQRLTLLSATDEQALASLANVCFDRTQITILKKGCSSAIQASLFLFLLCFDGAGNIL